MTPGIKAAGVVWALVSGMLTIIGCESKPTQATAADVQRYRQMVESVETPFAEATADEPSQVFGFAAPWDEPQGHADAPLRHDRTQPPDAGWPQRQSTLTPERRPYLPPADWLPGAALNEMRVPASSR